MENKEMIKGYLANERKSIIYGYETGGHKVPKSPTKGDIDIFFEDMELCPTKEDIKTFKEMWKLNFDI